MKDITPLLKKGQKVWFIDAEFRNGKEVRFAEYGTFVKYKDGKCVIDTYFTCDDSFMLPVDRVFLSKESCEKMIYIEQCVEELDVKESPTNTKISKIKKTEG